jgi:hypothetical protein
MPFSPPGKPANPFARLILAGIAIVLGLALIFFASGR